MTNSQEIVKKSKQIILISHQTIFIFKIQNSQDFENHHEYEYGFFSRKSKVKVRTKINLFYSEKKRRKILDCPHSIYYDKQG